MPRNARPPLRLPQRPGSGFTEQQKQEISAFVSNALNAQAEEILASVAETFRQWHANYVHYGCLVPDGVERIAAARDAKVAEMAAAAAAAASGQPAAEPPAAGQPEAVDAPPMDLTSRIIQ